MLDNQITATVRGSIHDGVEAALASATILTQYVANTGFNEPTAAFNFFQNHNVAYLETYPFDVAQIPAICVMASTNDEDAKFFGDVSDKYVDGTGNVHLVKGEVKRYTLDISIFGFNPEETNLLQAIAYSVLLDTRQAMVSAGLFDIHNSGGAIEPVEIFDNVHAFKRSITITALYESQLDKVTGTNLTNVLSVTVKSV